MDERAGSTAGGRFWSQGVEDAGRRIFDAGWRRDDSVFTPGRAIWTRGHAEELFRYFVEQPDLSGASYVEKLSQQLEDASDASVQLMAEMHYLNLLPLADYHAATKRRVIEDVLGLASDPIALPDDIVASLEFRIFSGGMAFKTLRWQQVSFLIQCIHEIKSLTPDAREAVLNDPWGFKAFVMAAPGPRVPSQRHSLLFLAFPSYFEPIIAVDQKKTIREAFRDYLSSPSGDLDRDLREIRNALHAETGGPIDYHKPPLVERWRPGKKAAGGDEVVDVAEPPVEAEARRAWLVRGSSVQGKDLVPLWLEQGFCSLAATNLRPIESAPEQDALAQMVEADYAHVSYNARRDKVREFHSFLSRMEVGDLVATTSQGLLYVGTITGEPAYQASPDGRSNLRRSVTWRNTDNPVDYSQLPEPLPARLANPTDVVELTEQLGLLEGIVGEETAPRPEIDVVLPEATHDLADSLHVTREWLQECIDLIRHQRQLIFYGPPGTGKTYIAQRLAWHLAGRDATKLVQFHPAYSYEDFFEGFRPAAADTKGSVGFELTPGPFRRMVDAARQHPERPHVLIIDEINRANLAKVFGELYFLLEYRDEAVDLLYSRDEQSFTLPKNVFVIGTMNTADRSIALVDSAMRRRFAFVALHPSEEPTKGLLGRWLGSEGLPNEPARLLAVLNERIEDPDFKIGPSYLMRRHIYEGDGGLERVWRSAIMPLLEEHHYGQNLDLQARYGLAGLRRALAGAETGEAALSTKEPLAPSE